MRLFRSTQYFDYPWEQVSAANWQKYPNEVSTHVKSIDVLRREYDPEKQTLVSERLISCSQPIPKWLLYITGGCEKSYVREVSTVDLINRTVIMRSCNLTWGHVLKVWETVVYSPDSADPEHRTRFEQSAEITAHMTFQRVCDKMEDWSVDRFGQNAKKGKVGFDTVLHRLDSTLSDIKSLPVLRELNNRTDAVLKEYADRKDAALRELNARTDAVLKEYNDRKEKALQDLNTRTNTILKEYSDRKEKTLADLNLRTESILQEYKDKHVAVKDRTQKAVESLTDSMHKN